MKNHRTLRVRPIDRALRQVYSEPRRARTRLLDQLVATILSQNTTDVNCDRAFRSLRARFPTWAEVAVAPVRQIARAIRSAGLANTKAPRIKGILKRLQSEYGRLSLSHLHRQTDSEAMEYLLSMPGVGPKTAACVLLFGMGRDVFPVDTHIHRLCLRLGLVPRTSTAIQTQTLMAELVPKGRSLALHLNLIRHGRLVCRARRPRCHECVLSSFCPSAAS